MSAITQIQNRALHSLLAQLNLMDQKAELVRRYTEGRTCSSREMIAQEAEALVSALKTEKERAMRKSIGKVIHLLCLLGYVRSNGEADYTRINRFIQNIGSNNPHRKTLHYLNRRELNAVVTQVEAMYQKETNAKSKNDGTGQGN